jgi:succinate dehydrogenase/fumarate reductase flavoprotein subunit
VPGWRRLAKLRPRANAATAVPAWDKEADVVVIGTGATGLPAAIQAREDGAAVILLEASGDIGGHAILSGGNLPLGGGTSAQKKHNIEDSADLIFSDLTDWSVVEGNGFPEYQVIDLNGQAIAGLYCGGESAGRFSQHGLARCTVQGRIAGRQAAQREIG